MRIYFIFLMAFLFNFTVLGMKEEDGYIITDQEIDIWLTYLPETTGDELDNIITQKTEIAEIQNLVKSEIKTLIKLENSGRLTKKYVNNFISLLTANLDLINNPFIDGLEFGLGVGKYASPVFIIWNNMCKINNNTNTNSNKNFKKLLIKLVELANPIADHFKSYFHDKLTRRYDLLCTFAIYSVGEELEKELLNILMKQIRLNKDTRSGEAIERSIIVITVIKEKIDEKKQSYETSKKNGNLNKLTDKFNKNVNKKNKTRLGNLITMIDGLEDVLKGTNRVTGTEEIDYSQFKDNVKTKVIKNNPTIGRRKSSKKLFDNVVTSNPNNVSQ